MQLSKLSLLRLMPALLLTPGMGCLQPSVPPGEPAVGNDWVLALDDPARGFGPPHAALNR